ncbi:MAG: ThuA domain-containing protein, partial [Cyclobacteriaceae bacterium]|nr:ThuA domain-containing protein [Cyclobacteriaceae bacterium]
MNLDKPFKSIVLLLLVSFLYSSCSSKKERILVFSKTEGYRHESIPVGKLALIDFGKDLGVEVDTTENADYFIADSLKKYSAVVFLNTTMDILNDTQQKAFEGYIKAGKGFLGI